MAKGKIHASATVVLNNMKATTATKDVEQLVVNDTLQDDPQVINPGVNTASMKN